MREHWQRYVLMTVLVLHPTLHKFTYLTLEHITFLQNDPVEIGGLFLQPSYLMP